MSEKLRNEVIKAFGVNSTPPTLLACDEILLQNSECNELLSRLLGVKWIDISYPKKFWSLCCSSEIWTGCLPNSWYQYYLPAMILVADTGFDAASENLRDSLLRLIERGQSAVVNLNDRSYEIFSSLSETQKNSFRIFYARFTDGEDSK